MEELGRAEVILDGAGRLEEAHELVDVRLEVVDLVWNWESQGLVAEGAVRTYIYYQKEDGTIEGEGVEIPFHGVVLPPESAPREVRVRLEEVREEHHFEPEDRSFTQSIHLRLVAEEPVQAPPGEGGAPEELPTVSEPVLASQAPEAKEPAVVEGPPAEQAPGSPPEPSPAEPAAGEGAEAHPAQPAAGEAPQAEPAQPAASQAAQAPPAGPRADEAPETPPVEPAPLEEPQAVPASAGPSNVDGEGVEPEEEEEEGPPEPQAFPEREPEEAPLVAAHVAQGPTGAGPGLPNAEPRPVADETVIVWKPFPDE